MSKVTSKRQVTLPKDLAVQYGIEPGDEIEWVPAGEAIRVIPARPAKPAGAEERLRLFDQATARQAARQASGGPSRGRPRERGWKREDLYDRGRPG